RSTAGGQAPGFRVLVENAPDLGRVLVVAIPLDETRQTLTRLLTIEVVVSLAVLAALAAAAWWLIKRDLRPLETMAVTADAIAAGDLTRRVQPAEPRTEVGRLGLSLNTMLGRIEEAFAERAATEEKLRRFLADASHELRTPLTSIRGYSEVFERAKDDPEDLELAMRRIEEESKRMGVMVEELLVLARLGEGREPERLPVDLARLVADAVNDARAAAPARDITLESVETADVLGDDHQLRQVVANLLDNALRHTPEGARIHVALQIHEGRAELAVADDGPGLEADVAAKVFEPFFRADASRARESGGAGLGLAIVAAIVEAHDGDVRLDTAPGAGATFTVTLPLLGGR
ncbi:MAG: sensor histidine kinase, partial [Deltaproteobacteria bacterium]